jgi:hypothetical protein
MCDLSYSRVDLHGSVCAVGPKRPEGALCECDMDWSNRNGHDREETQPSKEEMTEGKKEAEGDEEKVGRGIQNRRA